MRMFMTFNANKESRRSACIMAIPCRTKLCQEKRGRREYGRSCTCLSPFFYFPSCHSSPFSHQLTHLLPYLPTHCRNYKPSESDLEDVDDDDEDDDPAGWFEDDQDDGRKGQNIVEPDEEDPESLHNIIRVMDPNQMHYNTFYEPRDDGD